MWVQRWDVRAGQISDQLLTTYVAYSNLMKKRTTWKHFPSSFFSYLWIMWGRRRGYEGLVRSQINVLQSTQPIVTWSQSIICPLYSSFPSFMFSYQRSMWVRRQGARATCRAAWPQAARWRGRLRRQRAASPITSSGVRRWPSPCLLDTRWRERCPSRSTAATASPATAAWVPWGSSWLTWAWCQMPTAGSTFSHQSR